MEKGQAQGLLGITQVLADLPPTCSQATLRLFLTCTDPINQGLRQFGVDSLDDVEALLGIDFSTRASKRALRRFRRADIPASRS